MDAVRQLIQNAQKNDLAAFEQLVLHYQGRVYALAHRLTGDPLDAQDLAQEVFIRAYRGLAGFRGNADFGTWLHRITVNLWLNTRRKTGVVMVSLDEPVQTAGGSIPREVATLDGEPESIMMDDELSEMMQQALDGLPKEQKAILVLREIEGQSYDEIAVTMNCSLGTVRSRLSRARDALRRQVTDRARVAGIHITDAVQTVCSRETQKRGKERRTEAGEL